MYKIYCVQYDAGMCGTDVATLAIGEDAESVAEEMYDEVVNHFWSYNRESDFDEGDDDWCEPEIHGAWAEEFDPEKHGGRIHETAKDIARLQKECDERNA